MALHFNVLLGLFRVRSDCRINFLVRARRLIRSYLLFRTDNREKDGKEDQAMANTQGHQSDKRDCSKKKLQHLQDKAKCINITPLIKHML